MLLSEYIAGLQKVLAEHGDLPCYYARDDEGNGYQEVGYTGSVYYVEVLEHRLDSVYSNMEEYLECLGEIGECLDDEHQPIPVCIVN